MSRRGRGVIIITIISGLNALLGTWLEESVSLLSFSFPDLSDSNNVTFAAKY